MTTSSLRPALMICASFFAGVAGLPDVARAQGYYERDFPCGYQCRQFLREREGRDLPRALPRDLPRRPRVGDRVIFLEDDPYFQPPIPPRNIRSVPRGFAIEPYGAPYEDRSRLREVPLVDAPRAAAQKRAAAATAAAKQKARVAKQAQKARPARQGLAKAAETAPPANSEAPAVAAATPSPRPALPLASPEATRSVDAPKSAPPASTVEPPQAVAALPVPSEAAAPPAVAGPDAAAPPVERGAPAPIDPPAPRMRTPSALSDPGLLRPRPNSLAGVTSILISNDDSRILAILRTNAEDQHLGDDDMGPGDMVAEDIPLRQLPGGVVREKPFFRGLQYFVSDGSAVLVDPASRHVMKVYHRVKNGAGPLQL